MKKIFSIFLLLVVTTLSFSQGHNEQENSQNTLGSQDLRNNFDPQSLLKPRAGKQFLVNDFDNTLTADQREVLEAKLVAFDDSTSTQIAVVIIPSLNENDIDDYSVKLFREWGIGTKKNNNGVLLLIAKQDHRVRITTGYGVEGALPDITCKEIIDDIIVPQFKGEDYYQGIDAGTDAIMQAVKGEYTVPEGHSTPHRYPLLVRILFWIIGIIVLLFLIAKGWLWPLLNIVSSIVFSGSGSSGGSGGGFGGFGGGSSGGGGASGSW